MAKTVWLADTENVGKQWDRLLAKARKGSLVILYYTESSPGMPMDVLDDLLARGAEIETVRCAAGSPKKNALDFQLCTDLGARCEAHPKRRYIILSADTGYDPVCAYWTERGRMVSRAAPVLGGQAHGETPPRSPSPAMPQADADAGMTDGKRAAKVGRFRQILAKARSVSHRHHDALCAGLSEALDDRYDTPEERREAMAARAVEAGVPENAYDAYMTVRSVQDYLRSVLG